MIYTVLLYIYVPNCPKVFKTTLKPATFDQNFIIWEVVHYICIIKQPFRRVFLYLFVISVQNWSFWCFWDAFCNSLPTQIDYFGVKYHRSCSPLINIIKKQGIYTPFYIYCWFVQKVLKIGPKPVIWVKTTPFWHENNIGYHRHLHLPLKSSPFWRVFFIFNLWFIQKCSKLVQNRHFWPKIHHFFRINYIFIFKAGRFDALFYTWSLFLIYKSHFMYLWPLKITPFLAHVSLRL